MTVTNYSAVKLTSLTDADIQEALLNTVDLMNQYPNHMYHICTTSIKEWLEMVEYEDIKPFHILRVADAARKLNLKMLENEGIDDYIKQNFPDWTNVEGYRPYPDGYITREVQTFTLELLEKCRKQSKPLDIEKLVGFGGKKVEEDLQRIRLEEIHEPLKPVTLNGEIVKKYHRGFQTRAVSDTDKNTVDDICDDIVKGEWDAWASQASVFVLPKKYQYDIQLEDGRIVKVRYGIANGTHRWYGARQAGEEYLIAWVIDLPLRRLKQYATAVCNAPKDSSSGSSNKRTAECIVNSVVDEYEQGQTSFAKRLKDANDNRTEEPEKVIKEHLQDPIVGYSCRSREIPSLVKKIVSKSGVVEEYSRWSAADYASIYEEHSASTVKSVGKNKFFNSKTNLTTFINKDDTKLYDGITMKIAEKAVSDYDEYGNCRPIEICDLVPKDTPFNSSNCDEIRMRPVNKVNENINTLRRFVHLMDEKIGPNLSWTAAPQLKDEKENGLLPLEVYPTKDRDVKIS